MSFPSFRRLQERRPVTAATLAVVALLAAPHACPRLHAADEASEKPTQPQPATPRLTAADYEAYPIRSWSVKVERSLKDHPRRAAALALLDRRLAEVEALVPAAALPELQQVTLWLSRNSSPGACYHPSADWLRENGRVVEMARAIELQNIDHFLDWSDTQPLMVLHELAHAWHERVVPGGYGNPEIQAAFEAARKSGRYERVRRADGRVERHYALTNAMEYFAECSEAYFGRNDFQPFNHEELLSFDPAGEKLVRTMWKIPDAPSGKAAAPESAPATAAPAPAPAATPADR